MPRERPSEALRRTARDALMRLAPATMRSRIAVTALLVTLAVFLAAVGSFILAERLSRPAVAQEGATDALNQAEQGLQSLLRTVDAHLVALQYSSALHAESATAGADSRNIPFEIDSVADASGASCAAFIDSRGRVAYSTGDEIDVQRVAGLAPPTGANPVQGFVGLSGGAAALSIRPILGTPPADSPTGWIALAVPVSERDLALPGAVSPGVPNAPFNGDDPFTVDDPYFHEAQVAVTEDGYAVHAEIPAVDGVSAGSFTHEATGVWALADSVLGVTVLLATGFAMLVGIVVSLAGSRSLALQIRDATEHVRNAGASALQGLPVQKAERDPYMAEEFATLLDVFDRLLENAQRRQNEVEAARSAVEEAKRAAEAVVNESPETKVLVRDGRIVLANPAATTILGISASELVGRESAELLDAIVVHQEDGEPIEASEIIARAAERPWRLQIERPDGSTRWIELRATVDGEDRDERSFLLSGRDVTEEMRVEELRAEIVSLVSHDLRAPLTVIAGYLDLLGAKSLKPDAKEKAISQARAAAERMLTLLGDLLDVARADEILSPAVLAPVHLGDVVAEIVNSFAATAVHRFVLDLREDGVVLGDDKRLRQVIANLVTNAMKYSPEGSDISIEVVRNHKRILLSIEDEGPGIPEAQRHRIFERYTRVQQSESGKRAGIGLGLYIVKAIVEGHGGTVRVEDPEGSLGSRFVVDLPAAPETPPYAEAEEASTEDGYSTA
ncbi:MAG: ATP-binding protein [Coriobacteriia bacterium]|nr:ATP-binding protein [Coriobacteriia bacterium]